MNQTAVLELAKNSLVMALLIGAPMVGAGLIVGLVISLFQAVTQINEMTLTFVPKIVAVAVALIIFGPWMLSNIMGFTVALFNSLPMLAK